jgi:hypothetical protein
MRMMRKRKRRMRVKENRSSKPVHGGEKGLITLSNTEMKRGKFSLTDYFVERRVAAPKRRGSNVANELLHF